ncbi:MAG: YidC/Oxa1 family insertase periplasmic-domain containing protein, partial [Planctomycetota bacterium]
MARQALTFFIVFAGLLLVTRGCNKPPAASTAVGVESLLSVAGDLKDAVELRDDERGLVVTLGADGTIISAKAKDGWLIRKVNPARRPFHLLERTAAGTRYLPSAPWTTEKLEDGGYAFVHARGDWTIRKEFRLRPEGDGLDCLLKVEQAGEEVSEYTMTALSGVDLGGEASIQEPYTLVQVAGERARLRSWRTVIRGQERMREERQRRINEDEDVPERADYSTRVSLRADQNLGRLAVLGERSLVRLDDLPPATEVRTVAYKLQRDEGTGREIESWLALPLASRGYEGTFRLRWDARAKAGAIEPAFNELARGREEQTVVLANETLRLELTDRGASINSLLLKKFVEVAGQENTPENWVPMIRDAVPAGQRALTMLLKDPERYGIDPADATWKVVESSQTSATFRLDANGWSFEKRIALPDEEDRYDLDVGIRITKPDGDPDDRIKYVLVGPAGSYIADTKRGVLFTGGAQGFLSEREGGDNEEIMQEAVSKGESLEHTFGGDTAHVLKGIGVQGAFFTCILRIPGKDEEGAASSVRGQIRSLRMTRDIPFLEEGETYRDSMQGRLDASAGFGRGRVAEVRYQLYAGPNDIDRLRPIGFADAVDFGMFSSIGRLLMWVMKSFEGFLGSFGLAIMFMTLLVRAILLPVSYKSQLSVQQYSKRMQKLKPMLEELEKKFGKNRQRLNQERMRVMKENKVGFPLGCLMMFVQIPIWIALFGALRVEFSLRHEDFLWAADLSMPDRLFA